MDRDRLIDTASDILGEGNCETKLAKQWCYEHADCDACKSDLFKGLMAEVRPLKEVYVVYQDDSAAYKSDAPLANMVGVFSTREKAEEHVKSKAISMGYTYIGTSVNGNRYACVDADGEVITLLSVPRYTIKKYELG